MERVLTPDEKLKRAEEIYFNKKCKEEKKGKTVNVPVSNKHYILRKMIIQLIICFILYVSFYIIKNYNFIFSKEVIDKTKEALAYDINFQDIYCKIANYINNYTYFNTKKEEQAKENIEEFTKVNYVSDASTEVQETMIEASPIPKVEEIKEENIDENDNLSQMEIDAKDIKESHSFINPLKGVITSRYGEREPVSPIESEYHLGIDIAANTGTKIVASIDGTVVYSGELGGYGNCIEIQKDDILTIYGHCSELYVGEGETIEQGQKIAAVGETGNATGPHLHFEIRKDGRYVNPELIFKLD